VKLKIDHHLCINEIEKQTDIKQIANEYNVKNENERINSNEENNVIKNMRKQDDERISTRGSKR